MARGTATAHRGKGRAEGRAFLPSRDRSRGLEGRNAAWSGTTSLLPPSPRSNGKKCRLERHNFPCAAVTPVEWEEMPPGGAQRPSSRAEPRPSRKQRPPRRPPSMRRCRSRAATTRAPAARDEQRAEHEPPEPAAAWPKPVSSALVAPLSDRVEDVGVEPAEEAGEPEPPRPHRAPRPAGAHSGPSREKTD